MICPKCKSKNEDSAIICENCGFKLKLKCPHCGTYNPVGTKVCTSCSNQLLKLCPSCKAVNFATAKVCRKCSAPFSAVPKVEKTEDTIPASLEKYATLAVELINISSIKTNIKSPDIANKVISKFYQIFAKAGKDAGLKPLKLTENVLALSFTTAPSYPDSVTMALDFTSHLDSAFDEVSSLLETKLKISYKTRYLISGEPPTKKQEILTGLSLGVVNDVIFDSEIHQFLKDKVAFKETSDQTGNKYFVFLNQNNPETIVATPQQETFEITRMKVINELMNNVQMAKDGYIACLNGPTGIGKSNIFSALRMTFEEDNSHIWLLGQCSLLSKHSPLFFFKDLLQNLFDIPAFNIDIETTKKRVFTYLNDILNINEESLVNDIFSILFYDETKLNNPIFDNKRATYNAISNIFKALLAKSAVAMQIEDIENIDKFSLEILRGLFEDGILKCNFKIFITSNIETDIAQFLASPNITNENCFFAQYPLMSKEEIDEFIQKALGAREALGANILNHIYDNSQGMPVFVEEFLYLLLQLGLIQFTGNQASPIAISPNITQLTFPKTIQEIIQVRLTNISNANPNAFKALYYASILGYKFLPAIIENILKIDNDSFNEIIKFLSMNNFITPFDTYNYTFKNRIIWETIRNLQLSQENKVSSIVSSVKVLTELSQPDMTNVVHNLLDASIPKYDIITQIETSTKEAYAIGDDYAYICNKALLLDAVDVSTIENKEAIMLAMKEEILNMTYLSFPETAIKYADELVMHYDSSNPAKTIDILGLMSIAFESTGNYLATVECVDKALEKINNKSNQIAYMLLNYSKLNSILQLGRYEELSNIVKNDILPVLNLYFSGKLKEPTTLQQQEFFSILFETKYIYCMGLALQGSFLAVETSQQLLKEATDAGNNDYIAKAQIALATIKLLQGNSIEVDEILENIKKTIPSTKDSNLNTLHWLTIKNACSFMKGEYSQIKNEIIMLANFAQNIRAFALEPVIKGLFVKIALEEGNIDFAENLSYENYYKCSNNQWAFGALINWLMYCDISIFKEKYDDALKIIQYALDVAEKANINNLFFTAILKMKHSQIYSIREDFVMAKINAQEALQLANINGFEFIKAQIGVIYYDLLLNEINANPNLKAENIRTLHTQLNYSFESSKKLSNSNLSLDLKQKIEAIEDFAVENGISLT